MISRAALPCLLLLASAPALAGSAGRETFERACARCHVLRSAAAAPQSGAPTAAPQTDPARPEADHAWQGSEAGATRGGPLDARLRARPLPQVRRWVQAPQRERPGTACDTRGVRRGELDGLLSFLAAATRPPTPPREVLLQKNLERSLGRAAAPATEGP